MNKKKLLILAFSAFFVVLAAVLGLSLTVRAQAKAVADQAEPRAGDVWREPATGMEFVWIPTGEFRMGSNEEMEDEQPVHRVHIDGFWMGKYEVTQGQWKTVMHDNPATFNKGDDYPVETVNWDDTQDFIAALSAGSGIHFRLPTEAEWEYACKAGKPGQDDGELGDIAWFNENSNNATHPVGQKKPNAWGLYDMLGNVWEWCQDWYGRYDPLLRVNPIGPGSGSSRVIRGGSWSVLFPFVRFLNRGSSLPTDRGDYLGFRLAITNDSSLIAENKDGSTRLVLAVSRDNRDEVKSLIAAGADINSKNRDGFAPLHIAVIFSRMEMVELLIAKGANVNAKDDAFGNTPLHYAAFQGPKEMVGLLIAKGADIDAKDQFGYTSLHGAIIQGPKEAAELLIAKGAELNAKDHSGDTPLHYAAKGGHKEMAELLIAKGADTNARDQYGDRPLHLAAQEGQKEVVELLIAKGAEVNAKDNKGYTPLALAVAGGSKETEDLLRKHGAR
jgi:formylglycine-generating enzyme required for sulfatase activity/ankyrin repeat protein